MTDDLKKVPDILNVVLTPKEQSLVFHRAACKPEVRDVMRRLASRVVKLEEAMKALVIAATDEPTTPAAKEEVRGTIEDDNGNVIIELSGTKYHLCGRFWFGPFSYIHYSRILTPTELAPHLENLRAWLAKGGGE